MLWFDVILEQIGLVFYSQPSVIRRTVLLPQRIYKPHYDYQNFSSLANGVYFIAVTK